MWSKRKDVFKKQVIVGLFILIYYYYYLNRGIMKPRVALNLLFSYTWFELLILTYNAIHSFPSVEHVPRV